MHYRFGGFSLFGRVCGATLSSDHLPKFKLLGELTTELAKIGNDASSTINQSIPWRFLTVSLNAQFEIGKQRVWD